MSVVVTNFNYGHFLPACLESVFAQTRAPHEVVVVDDGSQDGSRAYLAGVSGARVILQDNKGQAAAFNAGFAASSGEAILFLDADDLLMPQAIETLARLWGPGIAGLCYDLEAVDIDGRPCGRYPIRGLAHDGRYRVLKELAIDFMPTSGNLLSRAAIAWAFPLPERRWRISADALLIRAAMLTGPVRQVPQTLARYRMHGHNNYFAEGVGALRQRRRGSADLAEAGVALVGLINRSRARELRAARPFLLCAAARRRLVADQNGAPRRSMPGFVGRLAGLAARQGELRLSVLFLLASATLPLSGWMRARAIDRALRPRWLQAAVRWFKSGSLGRGGRALLETPVAVADLGWRAEKAELEHLCAGEGWHWQFERPVALTAPSARFVLHRLAPGSCLLTLDLEPPHEGQLLTVLVRRNGALMEQFEVAERQACSVLLPDPGHIGSRPETFEVAVEEQGVRRLLAAGLRLHLHAVRLDPAPPVSTGAVLPMGAYRPFHEIQAIVSARNAVGPSMAGGLVLPLAPPHTRVETALSILLGADQRRGWLDISQGERTVWSGEAGPGAAVLVPVTPEPDEAHGEILLTLVFRDDEPLAPGAPAIGALGWIAAPATAPPATGGLPLLSPGEFRGAGMEGALPPVLGPGWTVEEDGRPVFLGLSATVRFALAPSHPAPSTAWLDLEPAGAVPDGHHLVVGIDAPGGAAQLIRLAGQERLAVPLGQGGAPGGSAVEITLHAALRRDGAGAPALDAHGGVRLVGLAIESAPGRARPAPARAEAKPQVRLLALADQARRSAQGGDTSVPARLREELAAEVEALSARALPSLVTPDLLGDLAALGARLDPLAAPEPPPDGAEAAVWLRYLARAALSGPAAHACPGLELSTLPPLSRDMARAVGRYLAADPAGGARLIELHASLLVRLLAEARNLIVAEEPGGARRLLAEAFLENVRPCRLLWAGTPMRDVARSFGAALETQLLWQGAELVPAQRPRAAGLLRVGVLVRAPGDTPDRRLLGAILEALPAAQFDVTVFAADSGPPAPAGARDRPVLPLAGLPLPLAVATIRARDLDVLLLGTPFPGFERITQIAAHRLARRQIAMSAVVPVTTGLSATDEFVLDETVAPAGCEADYGETCVRAPGIGRAPVTSPQGAAQECDAAPGQKAFRDWLPAFLHRGVALEPPPRYLFHHMPKTGGISTRKMFETWFRVVRDYREPWGPNDPPPVDLDTLGPDDLLVGHYATDGVPLARRYPEIADTTRWRRISFVRDPLDLALSYYFFERAVRPGSDPGFRPKSLRRYLREYRGMYLTHFECGPDNWREALERYWFIGTLERLPECMDWVARALGKPPLEKIRHDHAMPRDEAPDEEDVAVFVRNMAVEFEMYRWISERLEQVLNGAAEVGLA